MEQIARSPKELAVSYMLEPSLRDIFVEGPTDKSIIELFLEHEDINNISVYTIDSVNFKDTSIPIYSNRDKVIFLTEYLHDNLHIPISTVHGIIDKDFDDFDELNASNRFLLRTDFSCIESYIVDDKTLSKVLKLGFSDFPVRIEKLITEVLNVTKFFFLLRYTRICCGDVSAELVNIIDSFKINKDGTIDFNENEYIKKYCHKNNIISKFNLYISTLDSYRTGVNDRDIRHFINGHDFVNILFKYINSVKNSKKFKSENFEKTLYIALEISNLKKYELFKSIYKIYNMP